MRRLALAVAGGMLIVPAVAWVLAWLGAWSVDATAPPPAWERAIARMALDASVARRAPRISSPMQPTAEHLLAGMKAYRDNCAGCHGIAAHPSEWGSEDFYPRVPQFAVAPPRRPESQLFWIVKHGVRYSGMGAWRHLMPDSTIWQVVALLSRLDSLPPAVDAAWRASGR
jgi:mono/diheme cytochrome c family protein